MSLSRQSLRCRQIAQVADVTTVTLYLPMSPESLNRQVAQVGQVRPSRPTTLLPQDISAKLREFSGAVCMSRFPEF
jgi:hypothetical protein